MTVILSIGTWLSKKPHNDRCRNIIGQIGNDLYRLSAIFLHRQRSDIYLQNIFINHRDIIVGAQSLPKIGISFRSISTAATLPGFLRQILGHRSDSRSDLRTKSSFVTWAPRIIL